MRFSLERLSTHHISTMADASRFDYPYSEHKNSWCSIDPYLQDEAASVSLYHVHMMGANTLIMSSNDRITFYLPDSQDQNLLTLSWRIFSEWGRECFALSVALKASQYRFCESPQPIARQVTNVAKPNIVDTPLTHILEWGYSLCVIIYFRIVYQ